MGQSVGQSGIESAGAAATVRAMSTTVCALHGCPNAVPDLPHHHGYCEAHADQAILEKLDDLGGYLDQIVSQLDRLNRNYEEARDSPKPSRDW